MRVAIISAVKPLAGDTLAARGFARIGGQTILQLQLDLALALNCERIVCLSNDLPSELVQLQHDAEDAGAQFQCTSNIRLLSKLVSASDEILLIADGIVPDREATVETMSGGRKILTFPATEGVAAGFERIDRDQAWAGIMLGSGTLIERLAELPSDIDPQSSLLRLALQAGISTSSLDKSLISGRQWVIVESEQEANDLADRWLKASTSSGSLFAPISALASATAIAVLKRHSEPKRAFLAGKVLSGAFLGVAGICAYLGQPLAGFVAVLASSFTQCFGETIAGAFAARRESRRASDWWRKSHSLLLDMSVVALVAIGVPQSSLESATFAILVAIGLARIFEGKVGELFPANLVEAVTDRGTLAIICIVALLAGKMTPAVQILSLILLATILWRTYRTKLTPT